MTLPLSGPMSANMINVELGRIGTAPFDINGAAERTLAGVLSGVISFSDFYGKSAGVPPQYLWTNGTDTWTDSWMASSTIQVIRAVTPLTGKVYCEFTIPVRQGTCPIGVGIDNGTTTVFYNTGCWTMFSGNGGCGIPAAGLGTDGSKSSNAAYSFAVGVRIGIAFDATTGKIWYSKGGVWVQGDPGAGTLPSQTAPVATRYWHVSRYSCNISTGTNQILIHPRVEDQLYPVPSGFTPYAP